MPMDRRGEEYTRKVFEDCPPMTVIGEADALDQGRYSEPSVNAPAGGSEAPKDQHREEQHHSEVQDDIEGQLWMVTRRAAPGDRFQAMRPHCRGDECNFETVVDSGCGRGGRFGRSTNQLAGHAARR
jgi:hypothetical protein